MPRVWRMQCRTALGDVTDFCLKFSHVSNEPPHTSNYYRLADPPPWHGCGIAAIGWRVEGQPRSKDLP